MNPPTGTVTFLFTDVEGSTRRWQDEPEAMRALLVEHDAIFREVIDKHRGHLFKHTGDGVAAVFTSAADACAAAIDAQERLREVLPVRMGLHTGEAELRDGDYFGSTLNRCARLMGVAHGGQVVCSESTASLVRDRDDLRDLGEHRLRDLLRAERVWQVGGGDFAALRSLGGFRTNLPVVSSSFVGRVREIEAIVAALGEHRLVTLTGVGGAGKTRLAVQAAAELLSRFADGVFFAELADASGREGVADAVARAAGFVPKVGRTIEQSVVEVLAGREALVVLDNCEHLLDAAAGVVEALLAQAPRVRMLVTSREALGLRGEQSLAVRSLPADEGVALFVDRARDARPEFALDDATRADVVALLGRLDGIPLAIELAAARVRSMSVGEVLSRLDQRFRLLRAGRGSVERHQTLRATVDWSYGLLSDGERQTLDEVSVFSGGFTLDAAEAVIGAGDIDPLDVVDHVLALVDKSLIVAEPDGEGGTRYRLLETIRQYAIEQLLGHGDIDSVRGRHARWCADALREIRDGIRGRDEARWVRRLDAELDNLSAAVNWAIEHHDAEVAIALVTTIGWEALTASRAGQVISTAAGAISAIDGIERHPRYPAVVALTALAALIVGDTLRSDALSSQAVDLARTSSQFEPFPTLARIMFWAVSGRVDEMLDVSTHLTTAAASGNDYDLAYSFTVAAMIEATFGLPQASRNATEALDQARRLGNPKVLTLALGALCAAVLDTDPGKARLLLEEMSELASQHGYLIHVANSSGALGRLGPPSPLTVTRLRSALHTAEQIADGPATSVCIGNAALVAAAAGRIRDAVPLLAHHETSRIPWIEWARDQTRATLGPEEFERIRHETAHWSRPERVAFATKILDELAATL